MRHGRHSAKHRPAVFPLLTARRHIDLCRMTATSCCRAARMAGNAGQPVAG